MNIGSYRPHGSLNSPKHVHNPIKRNKIFQLAASNMFVAWAEVLANKLEEIINSNENNKLLAPTRIDPLTGGELELTAEDYYDEDLVNPNGNNCPYALQNIVCILLLEITMFLRETYQYMPKYVSISSSELPNNSRNYRAHNNANENSMMFSECNNQASNDYSQENSLFSKENSRISRVDYVSFE
jgi:hypothetical protein